MAMESSSCGSTIGPDTRSEEETSTSISSSEFQIILNEREGSFNSQTTSEVLANTTAFHNDNVILDSCSSIRRTDHGFAEETNFYCNYTSSPAGFSKDCFHVNINPSMLETKPDSDGPVYLQSSVAVRDLHSLSKNFSTVPEPEITSNQNISYVMPCPENTEFDEIDSENDRPDDSTFKYNTRADFESNLIGLICDDNADALINTVREIAKLLPEDSDHEIENKKKVIQSEYTRERSILDFCFQQRLLRLACSLDSVACAKALIDGQTIFSTGLSSIISSFSSSSIINAVDEYGRTALHHAAEQLSVRCIDLLLRKHAKSDLRSTYSNEGLSLYTPLEAALHNKRWQKEWQKLPAKEMINMLKNQDLRAVGLLANHTKETLNLACQLAVDGGESIALTALLLVSGKALFSKEKRYDNFIGMIVDKLLCSTSKENTGNMSPKDTSKANMMAAYRDQEDQRSSILKNLEITVLLKKEIEGPSAKKMPELASAKNVSPILRAAQAGDEMIVRILLNDVTCVNAADSDGNTALHLCLRANIAATKVSGIVWQLIRHGSSINARNRLGLTPVHMAAGHGHIQPLQLLLAQEPDTVHIAAETRETALFLAVKNNHIECAKLLLQFGSNPRALNLRRQRPIDFANSDAMRCILTQNPKYTSGITQMSCTDLINSNVEMEERELQVTNCSKFEKLNLASQDDMDEDSKIWIQRTQAKTVLCRYHVLPGGCSRGDACLYAHGEQELRSNIVHEKAKVPDHAAVGNKKIFVGGLPVTMGSDELKECFQEQFGPVSEAAVMGSQTGGQIVSRGFGFITFKNQSSYFEAVRQHFIILFGKKVEIKAAMQLSTSMDEELLQMQSEEMQSEQSELKLDAIKWPNISATSINLSMTTKGNTPRWLKVFKKWFPVFLGGIHQRQQRGESYPLSSVKADFRATCGMELDHAALGYPKLSDFLRTMPHVCQMKIVPVGRGPATHVILLPPSCNKQKQMASSKLTFTNRSLNASLVHQGRTYAAAVGNTLEMDECSINNEESTNSVNSNFNYSSTTASATQKVLADLGDISQQVSSKISELPPSNGDQNCTANARAKNLVTSHTCDHQEIEEMPADLEKSSLFSSLEAVNYKVFKNRLTEQVLAQGLGNGHPEDVFYNNLNNVLIRQTSNHQHKAMLDGVENYPTLIGSVHCNFNNSTKDKFVTRNFDINNFQDVLPHTIDKIPSTADSDSIGDHGMAVNVARRAHNSPRTNIQDLEDYPLLAILEKEYSDQHVIPPQQTMCTTMDTISPRNQASAGSKGTFSDRTRYNPTSLYSQQNNLVGQSNFADHQQFVPQCNDPAEVASVTHPSLHRATSSSYIPFHGTSLRPESKNYQAMQSSYFLDYTSSSYNPWNPNTFSGCKNLIQHMNVAASNTHTSEESSHESTLTSEDYLDSPTQSVNKQNQSSREAYEWMGKY